MAKKTFTIEGHEQIIEKFNNSARIVRDVGKFHLRIFGDEIVEEVKRFTLNAGAVDTNEFIQSIHQKTKANSKGVETTIKPSPKADKYTLPLEAGSKPHSAPIEALRGWAERHGVPVGAVWWSIKTKGTKPRWMWRDGFKFAVGKAPSVARDIGDDIVRKI